MSNRTWRGWKGDPEALEALSWITPTGYTSPTKAEPSHRKSSTENGSHDVIRVFFNDRGYGFTWDDVYVHMSDIVEGEPRPGARVQYVIVDTPKGQRAKNIYVGGAS